MNTYAGSSLASFFHPTPAAGHCDDAFVGNHDGDQTDVIAV
jgi:hypothetical protein